MASSFYRFAQRSLPSTAAAATATSIAALAFVSQSRDDKATNIDALRSSSGYYNGMLLSGHKLNFPSYSPAFTSLGIRSVALCEEAAATPAATQQRQQQQPYKPKDPADADTGADITSSDGKKVQTKAGMWGEEEDGLVSEHQFMYGFMEIVIECMCT